MLQNVTVSYRLYIKASLISKMFFEQLLFITREYKSRECNDEFYKQNKTPRFERHLTTCSLTTCNWGRGRNKVAELQLWDNKVVPIDKILCPRQNFFPQLLRTAPKIFNAKIQNIFLLRFLSFEKKLVWSWKNYLIL